MMMRMMMMMRTWGETVALLEWVSGEKWATVVKSRSGEEGDKQLGNKRIFPTQSLFLAFAPASTFQVIHHLCS